MARASGRGLLRERRSALVFLLPAISFLITSVCPMAVAQADTCSKPRVAVQLTEIHDEVFELLNSKSVPQPRESWIRQIQAKVVEELRMASPDTEFVSVDGIGDVAPVDCDYRFQYLMALIGAGEDIEIRGGVLLSEYTAYFMISKLAQHNPCGGSDWLLNVESTEEYEDVFQTIERNIETWGDIGRRIEDFEASHPVPPRGPELHHSQSREYVSPLEEERSLDIKIDVTNCRGEPVYSKSRGQRVVLPKDTERGEIRATRGFPQENLYTDAFTVLIIVRPQGAKATYTLKRGMEPQVETVEMTTCGVDAKLVEETEVHIHGIDIEVSPEKKVVCEGDSTPVEVKLSKVDTEGNKEPIAGQKVNVEVSGLIDGDVSPLGEVVTDGKGKVILSYRAGGQDSSVTFRAEFQPPDYPDSARDSAVVTTCKGDLLADITASIEWEDSSSRDTRITGSSEFSIRGKMQIEPGGGTAVITRYVPSDLELVTSYQEQRNRTPPNDGCPALYTRVEGGDTHKLAVEGLINSMAVYHQAGPLSGTYEVMLLGIPPTEVHGRKQRSSGCMQPECLCRKYEPYNRQVTIGRVGLRFPAGADGDMTGSRTWESHECAMKDMVGFAVNEAFGMIEFDPSTEGGDEDCTVRVSASWSFRPINRPQP